MDRILLLVDTMVDRLVVDRLLVMAALVNRVMNRLDLDDSSYLVCSETDCVMGSVGTVCSMISCMMPLCSVGSMSSMSSMSSMCCMSSMSTVMMVTPGSVRPGCSCGDE